MFSLTLSAPSSRLVWLALLFSTILTITNQTDSSKWFKSQIQADYAHFEAHHFSDSYKLVNFAMDQFDLCLTDSVPSRFKHKLFPAKLEITIQILSECALVPMDLQNRLQLDPSVTKNQQSFQREYSIPKFDDLKVEREYREFYSEHYSKDCVQVARMEHFTMHHVHNSQLEMNRIGYGVVFRKFWQVYVFSNAQTYVSQHFAPFFQASIYGYPQDHFLPTLVTILSSQLSSYPFHQLKSFLRILDLKYSSIALQKAKRATQPVPPSTLNHLVPIPPELDPFIGLQLSGDHFTSIATVQSPIKLSKIFSLIVQKFVHFNYNTAQHYPALFRAQLVVEVKACLLVCKQVFLHKRKIIEPVHQEPPKKSELIVLEDENGRQGQGSQGQRPLDPKLQGPPSGQGPQDPPSGQGPQDPPSGQGQQNPPSGQGQQNPPSGQGPQDPPSGQQNPPSGPPDLPTPEPDEYPGSFQLPKLKLKFPPKSILISGLAGFIAGRYYFNRDVVHPEDVIIPTTNHHDHKVAPSDGSGSGDISQTEWIWALGLLVLGVILLIAFVIGFSIILRSRRSHC